MMYTYIGYTVSVLGLALIIVGILGAALSVASKEASRKGFIKGDIDIPAVLKELPAVIDAILKAPTWLLCVLSGGGLVVLGLWLTGQSF